MENISEEIKTIITGVINIGIALIMFSYYAQKYGNNFYPFICVTFSMPFVYLGLRYLLDGIWIDASIVLFWGIVCLIFPIIFKPKNLEETGEVKK